MSAEGDGVSERVEASVGGPGADVGLREPHRTGAIVRLRDRYANDEISLDEFSRALDGVLAAQTEQELSSASPSPERLAPASRVSWLGGETLQRHLAPDEEILWVGRPETSLNLTRSSAARLVPVVAFMVLWEVIAVSSGAPFFFWLWGVAVVGFVAYTRIGRFVLRARRTIYAVTTRRIVRIVRRSSGEDTDSTLLRGIPSISVTQDRNGRGTVTFGDRPAVQSAFRGIGMSNSLSPTEPISFLNIAEPTAVARLIGSLQTYTQGRS